MIKLLNISAKAQTAIFPLPLYSTSLLCRLLAAYFEILGSYLLLPLGLEPEPFPTLRVRDPYQYNYTNMVYYRIVPDKSLG